MQTPMQAEYHPPEPTEVRALLERADLSTPAAAARLDVGRRQVQRWTSGATPMPYASLAALLALAFDRQPGPPADWRGPVADLLESASLPTPATETDPQ